MGQKGLCFFSWDGAASGETGRAVSYMACFHGWLMGSMGWLTGLIEESRKVFREGVWWWWWWSTYLLQQPSTYYYGRYMVVQ